VKVSLFIQECLQSNTGVIYLPMIDMAPPHVDIPGKIDHFDKMGQIKKTENISLTLSHDFMINVFNCYQYFLLILIRIQKKESIVLLPL